MRAIGYVEHWKGQRLLVELEDKHLYQAGPDLEALLQGKGTKIVVGRTATQRSTRRKYAICEIVRPGDWTCVEVDKLSYISSAVGSKLQVKAVHTLAKNKRKIFLLSDGNVYRCKKSKLESDLIVGSVV